MKEIKKSASFKSKQKGKEVKFNVDLNYSPEYDSFNIKVKEGEGFLSYSWNIERMPLEVIQKLNEMLEEVLIKAGSKTEMKEHKMSNGGDFQAGVYAEGGTLKAHGIEVGDTFLTTISGTIQKVKDKNGNIVYINLANGERGSKPPFPFDEGGEVKYYINKDGVKVRSKVEPEKKLTEAEWMAKHNASKEARTYGFGGLFSKSAIMSRPKRIDLNEKQVKLKSGEYVQVLSHEGNSLMVIELSKLGTGTPPRMVNLSDVDMTSFKNGGALIGNQKRIDMNKNGKIDAEDFKLLRSSMNGAWRNDHKHVNHNEDYEVRYARKKPSRTGYKGKRNFATGGGVEKISFEDWLKKNNIEVYKRTYYWVADDGGNDYMYSGSKSDVMKSLREDYKKSFATGGGISKFKMLSDKVARNYEGKRVKPQYQKEYGKVYSKTEAKEVGNKVAGKMKMIKKAESGAEVKKSNKGGVMVLAKQIRKEGESWKDALKRAGQQLK